VGLSLVVIVLMAGFPSLFELGCLLGVDVGGKVDICSHGN
jgi:hypothetical protein